MEGDRRDSYEQGRLVIEKQDHLNCPKDHTDSLGTNKLSIFFQPKTFDKGARGLKIIPAKEILLMYMPIPRVHVETLCNVITTTT